MSTKTTGPSSVYMNALLETKEEFELAAETVKSWFKPGAMVRVPNEKSQGGDAGKAFLVLGTANETALLVRVTFLTPEGLETYHYFYPTDVCVLKNHEKWQKLT